MLLLLPDQIRIGLGSSYAVLAKISGHKVTHWRMQVWDDASTTTPWEHVLPTISGWLTELKSHKLSISVVLSAELAPLHLLPWREDVTSYEKQTMLAKACFRRIHGEIADHWKIITLPSEYGYPWIASAIDNRLLKALTDQLQGMHLTSVIPLSLSLYNVLQTKLVGPACWLLVPEHKRLTAIHLRDEHWSLLQSLPISAIQHESIKDLLLRETQLAGLKAIPTQIYIASEKSNFEGCSKLDTGWKTDARVPPDSPLHLLGGRT